MGCVAISSFVDFCDKNASAPVKTSFQQKAIAQMAHGFAPVNRSLPKQKTTAHGLLTIAPKTRHICPFTIP
jgi:hypothetical protein